VAFFLPPTGLRILLFSPLSSPGPAGIPLPSYRTSSSFDGAGKTTSSLLLAHRREKAGGVVGFTHFKAELVPGFVLFCVFCAPANRPQPGPFSKIRFMGIDRNSIAFPTWCSLYCSGGLCFAEDAAGRARECRKWTITMSTSDQDPTTGGFTERVRPQTSGWMRQSSRALGFAPLVCSSWLN